MHQDAPDSYLKPDMSLLSTLRITTFCEEVLHCSSVEVEFYLATIHVGPKTI